MSTAAQLLREAEKLEKQAAKFKGISYVSIGDNGPRSLLDRARLLRRAAQELQIAQGESCRPLRMRGR